LSLHFTSFFAEIIITKTAICKPQGLTNALPQSVGIIYYISHSTLDRNLQRSLSANRYPQTTIFQIVLNPRFHIANAATNITRLSSPDCYLFGLL